MKITKTGQRLKEPQGEEYRACRHSPLYKLIQIHWTHTWLLCMILHMWWCVNDKKQIRAVFAETGRKTQRGVCVCVSVSVRWESKVNAASWRTKTPHMHAVLQMPRLLSQSGSTCQQSYVCVVSSTMPLIHCCRCTLTQTGNSYISVTPNNITHTALLYYVCGVYCGPSRLSGLIDCADYLYGLICCGHLT